MWEEFCMLFTDMGIISLILVICGIVFIGIEICIPGFGVFGVIGIACLVGCIIARAVEGASVTQICILIILCLLVCFFLFFVLTHSLRKGWLAKIGIAEHGQVLEKEYVSPHLHLIGKEGVTVGICRPYGSVMIDGEIYECVSEKDFIEQDIKVIVTKVQDEKIYVKILEE